MHKEKFISENFGITKAQLVKLRKSELFEDGVDYVKETKKNGVPVILWTAVGLSKLIVITGASPISGCVVQGSEPTAHNGQDAGSTPAAPKPAEIIETAPAIVKQKYPNKRMVRCEIRGQIVNVWVRDSSILKTNSIITAVHRGGRWVGNFKVGSNGRIHAS